MAQKQATFMMHGSDETCRDMLTYIEENGITPLVRDTKTEPLSYDELDRLLGHIPITHFLNPFSKGYKGLEVEAGAPDRTDVLHKIAEDNSLLRYPIIKTARLMTIGCDKKKIAEMLQFGRNGDAPEPSGTNRRHHSGSRSHGR